jgi:hypothetical protein
MTLYSKLELGISQTFVTSGHLSFANTRECVKVGRDPELRKARLARSPSATSYNRVLNQEAGSTFGVERDREKKSLAEVATQRDKSMKLFRRLNALSDGDHSQAVRQSNDHL